MSTNAMARTSAAPTPSPATTRLDLHGHGLTIYAIAIDPLIEVGGFPPGQDPNGNPDAE